MTNIDKVNSLIKEVGFKLETQRTDKNDDRFSVALYEDKRPLIKVQPHDISIKIEESEYCTFASDVEAWHKKREELRNKYDDMYWERWRKYRELTDYIMQEQEKIFNRHNEAFNKIWEKYEPMGYAAFNKAINEEYDPKNYENMHKIYAEMDEELDNIRKEKERAIMEVPCFLFDDFQFMERYEYRMFIEELDKMLPYPFLKNTNADEESVASTKNQNLSNASSVKENFEDFMNRMSNEFYNRLRIAKCDLVLDQWINETKDDKKSSDPAAQPT